MKRPTVIAAAVVVVAGLALGPSTPATAETGTLKSPRGDAPAAIDITRLSGDNGARRFSMQIQVSDLGNAGEFGFYYWGGRHEAPPARSLLIKVTSVEGHARARFKICDRQICINHVCEGLHARWDAAADRVSVSAPQRCYPRGRHPVPLNTGRFHVEGILGRAYDPGPSEPLVLNRG
jgi:hypothetical protein